ncbi:MAG: hypothetical protein NZ901_06895 [Geminocystis sp.]|nr:hypothetical protein [Geminocystis sp.]HIK36643.1 hypothetical protein [Geminocystis sp. M7585_C2015_104]MCS7147902.1 hypothetical protein [Geminocystis sp.]MCX8078728.1 hypothetical protein [Geminocystis sp.]MDW8117011.1 hypothetical protein [Geminocystis sp.]
MSEKAVNCKVECVNGCILGDDCPNREYVKQASRFIQNTPLEKMLEMAEEARLRKLMSPGKWVMPEDL